MKVIAVFIRSLQRVFVAALLFSCGVAGFAEVSGRGPKLLDESAVPKTGTNRASIRVNVDMTLVPVTVVDPLGRNVLGLTRENFEIYDGAEPRQIVSFHRQDAPVSVGIIFDRSGSMAEKLSAARAAASELFRQLNPEDEAFLVGVADQPEVKITMGSDFGAIANTLLFTRARGLTALLDAVYMGLNRIRRAGNPRKALVVVSDGGDNYSRYSMKDVLDYAAEAGAQIYTIGLLHNPHSPEESAGGDLLEKLAKKTGGRSFVVHNHGNMRDAMARIGVTLHNEYVLGYYPPSEAEAGKYRTIKVRLKLPSGLPKLQVYARNGYYAPQR
jgi:Ca-activated chloride channel family protein